MSSSESGELNRSANNVKPLISTRNQEITNRLTTFNAVDQSSEKKRLKRASVSNFKSKLAFKDSLRFNANIEGDRQSEINSNKISLGNHNFGQLENLISADIDFFQTEVIQFTSSLQEGIMEKRAGLNKIK